MPDETRVVTSLTPGSRLLVSGLVQLQSTEEDRVAREGEWTAWLLCRGGTVAGTAGVRWQGPGGWGRGSTSTEGARESTLDAVAGRARLGGCGCRSELSRAG